MQNFNFAFHFKKNPNCFGGLDFFSTLKASARSARAQTRSADSRCTVAVESLSLSYSFLSFFLNEPILPRGERASPDPECRQPVHHSRWEQSKKKSYSANTYLRQAPRGPGVLSHESLFSSRGRLYRMKGSDFLILLEKRETLFFLPGIFV